MNSHIQLEHTPKCRTEFQTPHTNCIENTLLPPSPGNRIHFTAYQKLNKDFYTHTYLLVPISFHFKKFYFHSECKTRHTRYSNHSQYNLHKLNTRAATQKQNQLQGTAYIQ